jgi:Polyketide cyclase / dehydrase and lipid transport
MADERYPLHHRSEVLLEVDAARLFAHLDDHRRLTSHMEKPSLMTAGASMRIDTDEHQGQAVGSDIRMGGRMLGLQLSVEEAVTRRDPPREKVWETIGHPRLLVIGAYRMGFTIEPVGAGSRLVVFIDYRLPTGGFGQILGRLLGSAYAAWCTRRMAGDALSTFGRPEFLAREKT